MYIKKQPHEIDIGPYLCIRHAVLTNRAGPKDDYDHDQMILVSSAKKNKKSWLVRSLEAH